MDYGATGTQNLGFSIHFDRCPYNCVTHYRILHCDQVKSSQVAFNEQPVTIAQLLEAWETQLEHWTQHITFAAETNAADTHNVTDAERHNTFSARWVTATVINWNTVQFLYTLLSVVAFQLISAHLIIYLSIFLTNLNLRIKQRDITESCDRIQHDAPENRLTLDCAGRSVTRHAWVVNSPSASHSRQPGSVCSMRQRHHMLSDSIVQKLLTNSENRHQHTRQSFRHDFASTSNACYGLLHLLQLTSSVNVQKPLCLRRSCNYLAKGTLQKAGDTTSKYLDGWMCGPHALSPENWSIYLHYCDWKTEQK